MFRIGSKVRIVYYEGCPFRTKSYRGIEGTITNKDDIFWNVKFAQGCITVRYGDHNYTNLSHELFQEKELELLPESIQEQIMYKLIREDNGI